MYIRYLVAVTVTLSIIKPGQLIECWHVERLARTCRRTAYPIPSPGVSVENSVATA